MSKPKFQGVAIEQWAPGVEYKVCAWLKDAFGPTNRNSWYIDQDYDLVTLVMRADIFSMYLLKFEPVAA
jgi:hypothetical protein